jgi:uncharacterized membrane protein
MESELGDFEATDREAIAAALREDERAAAAPWIHSLAPPSWYPVAGGLWFGVWAWVLTSDQRWTSLLLVPLLLLVGIYVRWYRKRRGTSPRWSGAPREIDRVLWLFIAIAAALVVGGVALDHAVGRWPMIAWVTVGVSSGLYLYEWRYARAARRARERLG